MNETITLQIKERNSEFSLRFKRRQRSGDGFHFISRTYTDAEDRKAVIANLMRTIPYIIGRELFPEEISAKE